MLAKILKKVKYRAFTFIELLVCIAISSIILLVLVPNMSDFVQKNRALAKAQQIVTSIEMTRSEAVAHNQNVTFCASDDGIGCGDNWNNGQLIIDLNNTKESVIRVFGKIHDGDTLTWNSSLSEDKNNYVEFLPTGETNGQQGSFYYCPNANAKNAFAIIIQQSGFSRIAETTAEGKSISCN